MKTQNEQVALPDQKTIKIPTFLQWVTRFEVLVLLAAGLSLFCFPDFGRARWVWEITPFNTVFLGAVYFAALVPISLLAMRRKVPVQFILAMQFTFTIILLIASLLYLDRFILSRKLVRGWFFLYSALPVLSAYYLWRYRQFSNRFSNRYIARSNLWQRYLWLQTIALTLYGVGLLIAPEFLSAFWPWKLDSFHARMYSSVFLTPAVGGWLLLRSAAAIEQLVLGLMQIALGILPIVGVVLTDLSLHRINWGTPGTWVWFGLFAALGIAGAGLVRQVYQMSLTLDRTVDRNEPSQTGRNE